MTKEQLLQHTIDYYSKDPIKLRCVIKGNKCGVSCYYSPVNANKPESEGCGIGQHLKPEVKLLYDQEENNSITEIFKNPTLKAMAPKWMQKIGNKFLNRIQGFHDCTNYWDDKGLTNAGKRNVNILIYEFDLKMEKFSLKD